MTVNKINTYIQSVSAHEWTMEYFINAKAVDTANPQNALVILGTRL